MQAELKTAATVAAVAALLTYNAAELVLAFVAEKVAAASRELGGAPPRHRPLWSAWTPGPSFWDYVRPQCTRAGSEKLRAAMRAAEFLLTLRLVSLFLFGALIAAAFLL